MPESSSAESPSASAIPSPVPWSPSVQLAMLLINALPFLHVVVVIAAAALVPGVWAKAVVILGGIYLVPPFCVRALCAWRPIRPGSHALKSPDFLHWWLSAQAQVLFCRFPFLEEALRMVPGLYSGWLRLWGAQIGRFTYWAPGVVILDRSLVEIGDNVVFGAGVRINPHVIAEDDAGVVRLHVAPVQIANRCRIGGYALLTAGTVVEPGQTLKAFTLSPPFTTWRTGKRARPAIPH